MKKWMMGLAALTTAALGSSAADLAINGDFKEGAGKDGAPAKWEQNKNTWNKPWGKVALDNGALVINSTGKETHLYTNARDFAFQPGDEFEIEVTAHGKGALEFGIYAYTRRGAFCESTIAKDKLSEKSTVFKRRFVPRAGRGNTPDVARLVVGSGADSDVVITRIAARLVEKAPAAAEELAVNGDFKAGVGKDGAPVKWEQNKGNWNKPWGSVAVSNGELTIASAGKETHLYTAKEKFAFQPGDEFEIAVTARGKGQLQFGIYAYNRNEGFCDSTVANEKLGEKKAVFKQRFTPRAGRGNTPEIVRLFVGAAAGSEVTISKIAARRLGMAPRPAPDAAKDFVLDDFSNVNNWKSNRKDRPVRSIVVDGNPALQLALPAIVTGERLLDMDQSMTFADHQGIRFRVKGEAGKKVMLPVTVAGIGSNQGMWRYTAYVPVEGDAWKTVTLAWDDFVSPGGVEFGKFGTPGALTAGGVGTVMFGDRWQIEHCNRNIAPYSVTVDDLTLVKKAAATPIQAYPEKALAPVIAKMKAGEPVSIICAGDSITAGTAVQDADANRYGVKLQEFLRKAFNNDKINVEVVAVGGARTHDLQIWAERDFAGKKPDLVTVLIGYNDKSAAWSPRYYRKSLETYLDKVKSITGGSPAFLLLATIPGQGVRYTMMDDFAAEVRQLGKDRKVTVYDLARDFKALPPNEFKANFADMAHPNNAGHEFMARKIADFLSK